MECVAIGTALSFSKLDELYDGFVTPSTPYPLSDPPFQEQTGRAEQFSRLFYHFKKLEFQTVLELSLKEFTMIWNY